MTNSTTKVRRAVTLGGSRLPSWSRTMSGRKPAQSAAIAMQAMSARIIS